MYFIKALSRTVWQSTRTKMMSKKSANKLFSSSFDNEDEIIFWQADGVWNEQQVFLFLALCTMYYVPSSKASTLVVKIKESIVSRLGVRNKIPFFLFIILHGVVFTSLDSSYAPSSRVRRLATQDLCVRRGILWQFRQVECGPLQSFSCGCTRSQGLHNTLMKIPVSRNICRLL